MDRPDTSGGNMKVGDLVRDRIFGHATPFRLGVILRTGGHRQTVKVHWFADNELLPYPRKWYDLDNLQVV